jgi:hypothetical protein
MPEGQMVSGRFVAPSWTQQLAGLVNAGTGAYFADQAEKQNLALAKKIREGEQAGMADYMSQLKGREGTPDKVTELAGPYTGDIPKPTATIAGRQAIQANPLIANMNASVDERLPSWMREFAQKEIIKPPKWEKDVRYDEKGREIHGWTNTADPSLPFAAQTKKPEMSAYEKATLGMRGAELADKGIGGFGGYSSPSGGNVGQPMGQPNAVPMAQRTGQPTGTPTAKSDPYAPSTMPKYEWDPSLTNAQNREQALEFSKENQKLVKNAKNSFDLLKATADTLATGKPSSGAFDNLLTTIGEAAGYGGDASKADAALKIFGEKLTSFVPRFEGPQSDKDTASYRIAAGDVGNPNKPIATRMAAVQTMIGLNKKYYPNGDWGSINTGIAGTDSKVSLGPSGKATAPAGIDPAVWNAMTPDERSLWQK